MSGNGNGNSHLKPVSSRKFTMHRLQLEERWPRLSIVFPVAIKRLTAFPKLSAAELGNGTWVYKTQAGADAPSLWLFYEIEPPELRLQAALADGKDSFIL